MADGRVVYQIVGDTSQLSADLKSAEGIIQQSASSWDSLAKSAAAAVGTAFTAATAAGVAGLTALGKEGLAYNTQLEQSKRSFATFLGDEKEAEKVMQKIVDYAAVTPFDVENLTNSVKMLVSADIAADEAIDTVLALGDAVAATGGGTDALSRMAANLQQVSNVGKASAMDVKQFAMAGINIYKVLSDYTGQTVEDLQSQEISYEMISAALKNAAAEGGRYYGAMESQSETLDGKISTLKDTFTQFTGRITEDLTPAAKVVVSALTDMLNNSGELEPVLKSIFSSISEGIITVFEKAGNLGDLISPVVKDISDLGSHLTEIMPKLKDLGGDVLDRIKERAGQLKDTLKPLAEEAFGGLKSSLSEIMPNLSELGGNTLANIKGAVADVDSKLESMIPKLGELGGELLEKIRDKADGLKEKFEPLIKDVIEKTKESLDNIMPDLRELGENILQNIRDALTEMKSPAEAMAEKVLPMLAEHMPNIIELLRDFGENIIEPITRRFAELLPKLQQLSDNIMPSISGLVGKVIDFLKTLVNDIAPPIIDFIFGIIDPLMEFAGTILPPLIDFIGELLSLLGEIARSVLPPILEHVRSIFEKLQPLAGHILADIIEFAKKIAAGAKDFIEKIAPIVGKVGEVAEALTDLLVSVIEPLWNFVQPIIDDALNQLISLLGEIIDRIAHGLNVVLDDMQKEIEKVQGAWETILKFLQGDFEGGWADVMNGIDSLTSTVMQSIKDAINDAINFVSKGVEKIKSVVNGIGSTIGALFSGEISLSEVGDYYSQQTTGKTIAENAEAIASNYNSLNLVGQVAGAIVGGAEKAAGGSTTNVSASGATHGGSGSKIDINVTTELDGEVVARNTYSRLDDYVGTVVRGQN